MKGGITGRFSTNSIIKEINSCYSELDCKPGIIRKLPCEIDEKNIDKLIGARVFYIEYYNSSSKKLSHVTIHAILPYGENIDTSIKIDKSRGFNCNVQDAFDVLSAPPQTDTTGAGCAAAKYKNESLTIRNIVLVGQKKCANCLDVLEINIKDIAGVTDGTPPFILGIKGPAGMFKEIVSFPVDK